MVELKELILQENFFTTLVDEFEEKKVGANIASILEKGALV